MGYSLLPGHKSTANAGWNEINLKTDLLDTLDVGKLSMGNYGNSFIAGKDKHAAHYAIPNPWAAAYLYHSVLKINEHQLTKELVELMLALLNDFYNLNKLVLRKISPPPKDSTFYAIWGMAPEFIKYEGSIYVFMNPSETVVYAGLSRSTLLWVSQNYKHNYTYDDLIIDPNLGRFLKYIKDQNSPESISGMEFNTFWANTPFTDMIDSAGKGHFDHELRDESPVNWLVGRKRISDPKGFKDNKYFFKNSLVFDKEARDDNSILGHPNPDNFKELLFELKSDVDLPLNQGAIKWTLFEELFEEKWVKLTTLDNANVPSGLTYVDSYIYPIKPNYLEYGFDPKKLADRRMQLLDDDIVAASNIAQTEEHTQRQYKHRLNSEVDTDDRGIAIWPQFQSNVIHTHIIEYNIDGFDGVPELEFFNSVGQALVFLTILKKKRIRLYKIESKSEFPEYIRITTKAKNSGIVKIIPQEKPHIQEEVTVSIDFGSTHTTVGFAQGNQAPRIMNFSKSTPFILANDEIRGALLEYFMPEGLLAEPPATINVYKQLKNVWTPFRTVWRQHPEGGSDFLSKGNIPICLNPESLLSKQTGFKESLKWDSKVDYRNGYLEQLITMVLVECETMGSSNLEIRWSYPRSFSKQEQNSMHHFFEKMQEKYGLNDGDLNVHINARGFSEAISAMDYFIHHENEFSTHNLVATVDVGGGTSDITFLKDQEILWEDSVKYGGDDIKSSLHHIQDVINAYRDRNTLPNLPAPFDYSKFISSWPGISNDWDGQMDDFIHNGSADTKLFFHKLGLFYAANFYYLGMHLKRKGHNTPLHMIAFAGNGTQFLKIVSHGNAVNRENAGAWFDLFKGVLADAQDISDTSYANTTILFSKDPKKEVAYGMIYSKQHHLDTGRNGKVERMIGLDCIISDANRSWSDDIPSNTCSDIDVSRINYDQFLNFIKSYYRRIQDPEIADYMRSKNLAEGLSDSNLNSFQNEISNYLERRSGDELATPLFFLAVKVWIDRLEKLVKDAQ